MTVTWIRKSVYLAVQSNSHNFKRGRIAVSCWGHQWYTCPRAIRSLWNGVLKAEHQRVASGSANSHCGCKRKSTVSLLGMGQWAISSVTPTRMEKYHHHSRVFELRCKDTSGHQTQSQAATPCWKGFCLTHLSFKMFHSRIQTTQCWSADPGRLLIIVGSTVHITTSVQLHWHPWWWQR